MARLFLLTILAGAMFPVLSSANEARLPAGPGAGASASGAPLAASTAPVVKRGAQFRGFAERFNRYYTDPAWQPTKTIYVSPTGTGNGTTPSTPTSVARAFSAAQPGTLIHFLRGTYQGCFELPAGRSGTYNLPIVLYGARNANQSLGVKINCCNTGRRTCFNFEAANYVAVDGFELIGGGYGVRAVGAGYAASQHQRGIAVLNCNGHGQARDPFFSGQSDWAVWEGNTARGAGTEDGHGIYLSNGGDWNIVRLNKTYDNPSSDFQINADPFSTCADDGIPFDDARCDAYAGTGEGGRGASDYFLVEANYFHHGDGPGANFTSVRRSIIRNNIFGLNARHNVSFWQETDNPKLGSRENRILHNLFITTGAHGVQFINNSNANVFTNNVLLGVRISGTSVTANPSALLMEVDGTVASNVYSKNLYVSGRLEGRSPNSQEFVRAGFSTAWFRKFPTVLNQDPNDFTPTTTAPFLEKGTLQPLAPTDRNGFARSGPVDLGPIEIRP
jgi:hypothetical protein